jgi:hypothetical protein
MIDAFSVTKKKAAAVAYKEKEKGRDVSTTEAVSGSVWQTDVFPLPLGVERTLVISFQTALPYDAASNTWRLAVPLKFPAAVALSLAAPPPAGFASASNVEAEIRADLAGGLQVEYTAAGAGDGPLAPALESASCPVTGLRHFGMFIPAAALEAGGIELAEAPGAGPPRRWGKDPVARVGVVWDVSGSRSSADTPRLEALLAELADCHDKMESEVRFELYTLSTELDLIASDASLADATARVATGSLLYDGGTDLSLLADLPFLDYCVLVSDGIDNFGTHRQPQLDELEFPIHVAIAKGGVHGTAEAVLRSIAALTGGVSLPLRSPELAAVVSGLAEQVVVACVRVDGLDEEQMFDASTGFATVPDCRIVTAPPPSPLRNSDPQELFLGPKKYSLLEILMEIISWAQVTFLGVGIARTGDRVLAARGREHRPRHRLPAAGLQPDQLHRHSLKGDPGCPHLAAIRARKARRPRPRRRAGW